MRQPALRFEFYHEGPVVELRSTEALDEAVIQPSDELGPGDYQGFWFELRDENDRVLYRKVIHNPIRLYHEVFDEYSGRPSIAPRDDAQGWFWLTAPNLPEAKSVVLYSSPLRPREYQAAAHELVRLPIEGAS